MKSRGFTLIETFVAVTLVTVAIVAPMSLAAQALSSAYYARDQITAANLAQEGIEALRAVRDGNILKIALGQGAGVRIFDGVPLNNTPFIVDTRYTEPSQGGIVACSTLPGGVCPPMTVDAGINFYGHGNAAQGWQPTRFTRILRAQEVACAAPCVTGDEIRVNVVVSWSTPSGRQRSVTISENLYRWIQDGAAVATP